MAWPNKIYINTVKALSLEGGGEGGGGPVLSPRFCRAMDGQVGN